MPWPGLPLRRAHSPAEAGQRAARGGLPPVRWLDVRVGAARVRCLEVGAAADPPVLFLHGWGLSPRVYLPAVSRLCRSGVRVLAPTLPGFGASSPLRLAARVGDYAARVAEVLDELDLGASVVIGHSLGGGVALQLATDRPDLVRGLVLVNAVGGAPSPAAPMGRGSWLRWALAVSGELDPRDFLAIGPRMARDFLPNALRHPLRLTSSAVLALGADLSAQAAALVEAELPVLFVWGDRDRLVGPGSLELTTGRLTPEVVHGRHGWMLRHPDQFAQLLGNALFVEALLETDPGAAETLAPVLR